MTSVLFLNVGWILFSSFILTIKVYLHLQTFLSCFSSCISQQKFEICVISFSMTWISQHRCILLFGRKPLTYFYLHFYKDIVLKIFMQKYFRNLVRIFLFTSLRIHVLFLSHWLENPNQQWVLHLSKLMTYSYYYFLQYHINTMFIRYTLFSSLIFYTSLLLHPSVNKHLWNSFYSLRSKIKVSYIESVYFDKLWLKCMLVL